MHTKKILVPLLLAGGFSALGCENITVDETGGGVPPAGVIRGTVTYDGPPPCSQNGHIVGNAVLLVFDAHNPPPPNGLGVTAANFGVVSGDALFSNWPVAQGPEKVCPPAGAASIEATASYAISPMSAGQYVIQGFFDYTSDFFATFKFRQLPEATDVGGGYINLTQAQELITNAVAVTPTDGGAPYFVPEEAQNDPNYIPSFLPVPIGTPGPVPSTSLHGIPSFTMPLEGYLADNIPVFLGATLPLARPYFYPQAGSQTTIGGPLNSIDPGPYTTKPLTAMTVNAPSSDRPSAKLATPQNPSGDVDFIPILSFPQDFQIYAQPDPNELLTLKGLKNSGQVTAEYQAGFPLIQLNAGLPLAEQKVGADTSSAADVFHMQLGVDAGPGAAPGGNGGIFVWWNSCAGLPGCDANHDAFIPEAPGQVYRMWPLVVLAKLNDLPSGNQPSSADPQSLNAQGSDATKPIVIIQGITLNEDSFFATTQLSQNVQIPAPLSYPDYAGKTNLYDHMTAMIRPSTICMDPRAPDNGGIVVATGAVTNGVISGPFSPTYQTILPPGSATSGTVVAAAALTNPQLAQLVNHNAAGSTNGLVGGCLPTGRYQVNLVYPTGQAWTTPNETGSCAAAEGNTLFTGSGTSTTVPPTFPDPLVNGCSATSPRPALYSQGTRAVIEITPATDPANCATFSATGKVPVDPTGKPTANLAPFACTGLCSDPSLDPTTAIPCTQCLDNTLSPSTTPPCTTKKL